MTSRIRYNNPMKLEALGLPYHYEMVSDVKRVAPFKKAIQETCRDKIVLESGTGSAIMSILAARTGAKKVYAVEIDPNVAQFARQNIKKNGLQDTIKLIQKDTCEVTLRDLDGQKADVVIAENLSTWLVTEPQIPIMNHINQYLLKENGIAIPTVLYNYLELAQSQYHFENAIELRTHYFEFTGIKQSALLSNKVLFEKLDMRQANETVIDNTVKIEAAADGIANSLRLTSPLEVYGDIRFESSDSLMPPVIVPLQEDIRVSKGDILDLRIQYQYNSLWEDFFCEAKVLI